MADHTVLNVSCNNTLEVSVNIEQNSDITDDTQISAVQDNVNKPLYVMFDDTQQELFNAANIYSAANVTGESENANGSAKKEKRKVNFPSDSDIVNGYFDPPNPWQDVPQWQTEDLLQAYKQGCEKHGVKPLNKVLQQLQGIDSFGDRYKILSLKGECLNLQHCESLEGILKYVRFQCIDLEATHLDDDMAVALFEMVEYYESACKLNISFNKGIGPRAWQSCARLIRKTPCLTFIDARSCDLNERMLPILGRSLRMGCFLQRLHLQNNNLAGRALLMLVAALKENNIMKELFLGDNKLMPIDGIPIGNLLKCNHKLELLDLRNNCLLDVGVGHICDGLAEQTLESGLLTLVLWNNQITCQGMASINRALTTAHHFETLNLGHNPITNEGIYILKEGLLKSRGLLKLGLAGTKVSCAGAVALAEVVADNTKMLRLELQENDIKTAGLMALSLALKENKNITKLDVDRETKKEAVGVQDYADQQKRLKNDITLLLERNRDVMRKHEEGSQQKEIIKKDCAKKLEEAAHDFVSIESNNEYIPVSYAVHSQKLFISHHSSQVCPEHELDSPLGGDFIFEPAPSVATLQLVPPTGAELLSPQYSSNPKATARKIFSVTKVTSMVSSPQSDINSDYAFTDKSLNTTEITTATQISPVVGTIESISMAMIPHVSSQQMEQLPGLVKSLPLGVCLINSAENNNIPSIETKDVDDHIVASDLKDIIDHSYDRITDLDVADKTVMNDLKETVNDSDDPVTDQGVEDKTVVNDLKDTVDDSYGHITNRDVEDKTVVNDLKDTVDDSYDRFTNQDVALYEISFQADDNKAVNQHTQVIDEKIDNCQNEHILNVSKDTNVSNHLIQTPASDLESKLVGHNYCISNLCISSESEFIPNDALQSQGSKTDKNAEQKTEGKTSESIARTNKNLNFGLDSSSDYSDKLIFGAKLGQGLIDNSGNLVDINKPDGTPVTLKDINKLSDTPVTLKGVNEPSSIPVTLTDIKKPGDTSDTFTNVKPSDTSVTVKDVDKLKEALITLTDINKSGDILVTLMDVNEPSDTPLTVNDIKKSSDTSVVEVVDKLDDTSVTLTNVNKAGDILVTLKDVNKPGDTSVTLTDGNKPGGTSVTMTDINKSSVTIMDVNSNNTLNCEHPESHSILKSEDCNVAEIIPNNLHDVKNVNTVISETDILEACCDVEEVLQAEIDNDGDSDDGLSDHSVKSDANKDSYDHLIELIINESSNFNDKNSAECEQDCETFLDCSNLSILSELELPVLPESSIPDNDSEEHIFSGDFVDCVQEIRADLEENKTNNFMTDSTVDISGYDAEKVCCDETWDTDIFDKNDTFLGIMDFNDINHPRKPDFYTNLSLNGLQQELANLLDEEKGFSQNGVSETFTNGCHHDSISNISADDTVEWFDTASVQT